MGISVRPDEGKVYIERWYKNYCYRYNPDTGELHKNGRNGWKILKNNTEQGYSKVQVGIKKLDYAHRIIVRLCGYELQKGDTVDHIDRDPTNNKADNLRIVSHQENCFNRGLYSSNKSGYRGVSAPAKEGGNYIAQIKIDGVKLHIGCYPTAEQAAAAYNAKSRELHGETGYQNLGIEQ